MQTSSGEEFSIDSFWNRQDHQCFDLMGLTKKSYHSTNYFFTVIDNKSKQELRFHTRPQSIDNQVECWISGQHIKDGDYITLEPGYHPLTIRGHMFRVNSWGKSWFSPRLSLSLPEEREAGLAAAQMQYDMDIAQYNEELAYYKKRRRITIPRLGGRLRHHQSQLVPSLLALVMAAFKPRAKATPELGRTYHWYLATHISSAMASTRPDVPT